MPFLYAFFHSHWRWLLLALAIVVGVRPAQAGDSQYYSALEVSHGLAPSIDGNLDDSVWLMTNSLRDFNTIAPGAEAAPVVASEVMLAYDAHFLYIGIRGFDPQPSDIRQYIGKRDQIDEEDDAFTLYFDLNEGHETWRPAHLSKNEKAQFFRVSASGAQADGIFHALSGNHDLSPDFAFESAVQVNTDGWSAELKIPLSQLRLEHASKYKQWGMVLIRQYTREKNWRLRSAPLVRNVHCFLCSANEYHVAQASRVYWPQQMQIPLQLQTLSANSRQLKALELSTQALQNVLLEASFQPTDQALNSVTDSLALGSRPFAAVRDEERPFFLANTDLFPPQLENANNYSVYTRSITDHAWGLRASSRGKGAEGILLSSFDHGGGRVLLPTAYQTDFAKQPASLASIAHARLVMADVQLGALFSDRDYHERGFNRVIGPNLSWRLNEHARLSAHWLMSQTTAQVNQNGELEKQASTHGEAQRIEYNYRFKRWEGMLYSERVSPGFRADNGFYGQAGYSAYYAQLKHKLGDETSDLNLLLTLQEARDWQGNLLKHSLRPALHFSTARDTSLNLEIASGEQQRLSEGGQLHSVSFVSMELSSALSNRLPRVSARFNFGDKVDWQSDQKLRGGTLEFKLNLKPIRTLDMKLYWLKEWLKTRNQQQMAATQDHALQMQLNWELSASSSVNVVLTNGKNTRNPLLLERSMELAPFDTNLSDSINWQKRFGQRVELMLGVSRARAEGGKHDAYIKMQWQL